MMMDQADDTVGQLKLLNMTFVNSWLKGRAEGRRLEETDRSPLLKGRPTVVIAQHRLPSFCSQPELTSGLALHSTVVSQRDRFPVRNGC